VLHGVLRVRGAVGGECAAGRFPGIEEQHGVPELRRKLLVARSRGVTDRGL
jgi:hypothetical protein